MPNRMPKTQAGQSLLPGNLEDVPTGILDQTTLTGHICPDSGTVHRNATCHIICGSDRHRHDARQNLTPTTGLTFSQINGRLCPCATRADTEYITKLGQPLMKLRELCSDITRAQQQTADATEQFNNGDLRRAEQAFNQATIAIDNASRLASEERHRDTYRSWATHQLTQVVNQLTQLRTAIIAADSRTLAERTLPLAAVHTQFDAHMTIDDRNLMVDDLNTIRPFRRQNTTDSRQLEALRNTWLWHATSPTYDHDSATKAVADELTHGRRRNKYTGSRIADPNIDAQQATDAAEQLTDRWQTAAGDLQQQHQDATRLVAVHLDLNSQGTGAARHIVNAYQTRLGQLHPHPNDWTIQVLDTPMLLALQHARQHQYESYVMDLGPAEPLRQQAEEHGLDLDDALNVINHQVTYNDLNPEIGAIHRDVQATIAALTS